MIAVAIVLVIAVLVGGGTMAAAIYFGSPHPNKRKRNFMM